MSESEFRPQNLALAAIGLSLATFMQVLDSTIANVALPTIAGNLGVSSDQSTWVITSFAVCNAIGLPLTGWLARYFGQLKLFLASVVLFSLTSFLCGIAHSMPELIFFRALQGFVAAPMFPIAQTLLLSIFPISKRGTALALLSMVTVVAPIAGPITGGWITDNYSWPWIFYINVPIGILATFVVWLQLRERPEVIERKPIDYVGLGFLVIGVGMLQIVLDKGNDLDWFESDFVITCSIISAVTLIAFVIWEMTDQHPIVDLRLLRYRNFTVGTISLVFGYAAFFAINLLLPQWLQTQMGYNAVWAGLAAAPMGILPFFLSPLVGRYAPKLDMRLLITGSFIVTGGSCFLRAGFNTDVNYAHIAQIQIFMGLGISLFFMPLTTIILSELPPNRIADGSGLATFLRILGGSFAASLTTWMWNRRAIFHHAQLGEHISVYSPSTLEYLHSLDGPGQEAYAAMERVLNQQAYMMSTVDYFTLLGWMFMGLVVIVWLARPPFIGRSHVVASE